MDRQSTHTVNWHHIIFCFLLLLISDSVSFADNATANRFILATPHQSTYILEKYGTEVGEITNQLSYADGKIIYESVATATGVASLFFSESISEQSVLYWPQASTSQANQDQATSDTTTSLPQLLSYQYTNPAKKKKNQQISLIWLDDHTATITSEYRKKTSTLQTNKVIWSRQFLPIVMSSDLLHNSQALSSNINIVEKDRLESYTYKQLGNEEIEFQDTLYPCIKFEIKKLNSNRVSYVWLAKAFDYLPLKIEQYKNDKPDGSMQLKQFKRTP